MDITICRVDESQAEEVRRIMRQAFEEYRHVLVPLSGALGETTEAVMASIRCGGAFLAYIDDVAVGSARYRIFADHSYLERVSVLPEYRGKGVAGALMAAFECVTLELQLPEARLGVRTALPNNVLFYQKRGYQEFSRKPYPQSTDVNVVMSKRLWA